MGKYKGIQQIGADHSEVKKAIKLVNNKKIDEDDLCIIEGCWAYEKLLQSGIPIKTMLFCPGMISEEKEKVILDRLIDMAESVYIISEKVCNRISDRDGPEGCFLLCRLRKHSFNSIKLKDNNIVIILDGLEKPGNIGTIIRSADAAGADAVISCNARVRLTHHRLIKASMGSSFTMPVIEAGMDETVEWLKANDFRIFLTDLKATRSCYEVDYSGRIAVVAGNEIHGISGEWYKHDCERVIIPMFGGADSLNVGFATTLVAYEAAVCQRGLRKKGV